MEIGDFVEEDFFWYEEGVFAGHVALFRLGVGLIVCGRFGVGILELEVHLFVDFADEFVHFVKGLESEGFEDVLDFLYGEPEV